MLGVNDKTQKALLELLRAGLWEKDIKLSPFGELDFSAILDMSEEQGVVGLVAAGLEHITDMKPAKKDVLQFIGRVTQLEQRNIAMNYFIGVIVDKMREAGITTLIVKGQGVAQCYERPLWRPSGDVDFLLDIENYGKADEFFTSFASYRKFGGRYSQEVGFGVDPWTVEIHGTLRTGLSGHVDKIVDSVQKEAVVDGKTRTWLNGSTQVLLPAPDHDVFLVFTHFIKHFYKEGVGLRQICDWCRLLWTCRFEIDSSRIGFWLKQSGLIDEWRSFAALVVEYLSMPSEAIPMYSADNQWSKKATQIMTFILKRGGQHKLRDTFAIAKIFPWHAVCYAPSIFLNVNGLKLKERIFGEQE